MHPLYPFSCISALCLGVLGFVYTLPIWVLVSGVCLLWYVCLCVIAPIKVRTIAWILILGALAIFGWHATQRRSAMIHDDALHSFIGQEITCQGMVAKPVDARTSKRFITIRIDHCESVVPESPIRMRITDDVFGIPVSYGDTIALVGVLEYPEAFQTDTGRTFHYDRYLATFGIGYVMRYGEMEQVQLPQRGARLKHVLFSITNWLEGALLQTFLQPAHGLALGMLIGEQSGISESWQEIYRDTGVMHLVVLSGYNAVLVASLGLWLFRGSGRFGQILGGIGIMILFVLMVSGGPSLVRATIMVALALVGNVLGYRTDTFRALMIACGIMVALNPLILTSSMSFHLSFLATLGIIVFGPLCERMCAFIPETGELRTTIAITCATQLGVLPYLIGTIGELSLVSLIANACIVWLVPFIMAGAGITALVSLITMMGAGTLGLMMSIVLNILLRFLEIVSTFPWATVSFPPFSPLTHGILWTIMIGGMLVSFWWRSDARSTEPTLRFLVP
jgi:ComEC/Rec2-related protein